MEKPATTPATKPDAVPPAEAWPPEPDISHLITQDDTPVESYFHDSQMRLLSEPLSNSDVLGEDFIVATDVAVFFEPKNPALVPDVLISRGVRKDKHRGREKAEDSYFVWLMGGLAPELVIEIVSKTKGEEHGKKFREYARGGVGFYVVFDPEKRMQEEELQCYVNIAGEYERMPEPLFKRLGLQLVFWEGSYDNMTCDKWLRWATLDGELLPTGADHKKRAEDERKRADALQSELEALRKKLDAGAKA